MAEKVTEMKLKLKVDLQCPSYYKKVKKILCKIPQIRDQKYDEKQNLVIITVVCCSPEKIRDKLCCKGCKFIQSIEFVEPPKEQPQQPPPPPPPPPVTVENTVIIGGYGLPVPPPPCHCGCGYRYCYGRGYSRCDYFSEENTGGCTVM